MDAAKILRATLIHGLLGALVVLPGSITEPGGPVEQARQLVGEHICHCFHDKDHSGATPTLVFASRGGPAVPSRVLVAIDRAAAGDTQGTEVTWLTGRDVRTERATLTVENGSAPAVVEIRIAPTSRDVAEGVAERPSGGLVAAARVLWEPPECLEVASGQEPE